MALDNAREPSAALTHGRHCSCSACAREDWTKITAPCGMHGPSCPAIYAPDAAIAPKRAYRYRITHSDGCLAEQTPVGSHVLDWKHMGKEHTWTVYNLRTGDVTGSMTGVLVDEGYKTEDGTYEAD